MKKYVKSNSDFLDVVEIGNVIGNVNTEQQLEVATKAQETLKKYKLSSKVVHWKFDEAIDNNNLFVYLGVDRTREDYVAVFNKFGEVADAFISASDYNKEFNERFLEVGQKLLKAIDGD